MKSAQAPDFVRGPRGLAVELIVDLMAQGWSEEEILKNYPGLTHETSTLV